MSASLAALKTPYDDLIEKSARQWGLDPLLVKAVIQQESDFDPNAVSPKNAGGLMQLMPPTARQPGFGMRGMTSDDERFDPEKSIAFGTEYLRKMVDEFDGNVAAALAAYNAGPGTVRKWLAQGADPAQLPEETRNYIDNIRNRYTEARSAAGAPTSTAGVPRETPAQNRYRVLAEEALQGSRTRELLNSKPKGFARFSDEVEFGVKSLAAGALDTLGTLALAHSFMPGLDGYKIASQRAEEAAHSMRESIPEWMRPAIDKQIIERDEEGNPTGFNIPSIRKITNLILESASPSAGIIVAGRALGKQIIKRSPQFGKRHSKFVTASSLGTANSLYVSTEAYGEVYNKVLERALEEGKSQADAEQEASMAGAVAASRVMPVSFITGATGEGLAAIGSTAARRMAHGILGGSATEFVEESWQYLAEQYGLKEPANLADFLERGFLGAFAAGPVEGGLAAVTGDPNAGRPPPEAAQGYESMGLTVRQSVNELAKGMANKLTGRVEVTTADLPPPGQTQKEIERRQADRKAREPAPLPVADQSVSPLDLKVDQRQQVAADETSRHERVMTNDDVSWTEHGKGMAYRDTLSDPEGNVEVAVAYEAFPDGKFVRVTGVPPSKAQGKGKGMKLYERFVQDWTAQGYTVYSDRTVTRDAQNIYEGLSRRGYAVERSPNARRNKDGKLEQPLGKLGLEKTPFKNEGEPDAVYKITPTEVQPGQGTLSLPPGPDTEGQLPLGQSDLSRVVPQEEPRPLGRTRGGKFLKRPEPVEETPVEQDFTRDEKGRINPQLPLRPREENVRRQTAERQAEQTKRAKEGEQLPTGLPEPRQPASAIEAEFARKQATTYGQRMYGGMRLADPENNSYDTPSQAKKATGPLGRRKIVRIAGRYYVAEPAPEVTPEPETQPEAATTPEPEYSAREQEVLDEATELDKRLDEGNLSRDELVDAYRSMRERYRESNDEFFDDTVRQQVIATGRKVSQAWSKQEEGTLAEAARSTPEPATTPRQPAATTDAAQAEPAPAPTPRPEPEPAPEAEPEPAQADERSTAHDGVPESDETARRPHATDEDLTPEEFQALADEAVAEMPVEDAETSAGSGQANDTAAGRRSNRREMARQQRLFEELTVQMARERSVHWTALVHRLFPGTSYVRRLAAKEFEFTKDVSSKELLRRVFKSYVMLLRMYVQDSFMPVRHVQELLEKVGVTIEDQNNFYRLHELMQSRTDARWTDMQRTVYDPIADRMRELGITQEELDNYLWYTHAEWRNRFLERRKAQAGQERVSGQHIYAGIKTGEAKVKRDQLIEGREEAFRELDAMIRPAVQRLRDTYGEYGLVPDSLLELWNGTADFTLTFDRQGQPTRPDGMSQEAFEEAMFFATYVPLRDFRPERYLRQLHRMMGADEHMNPSADVFGDEVREALGRTTPPAGQLSNIQAMQYMALVRGERNKMIGGLYDLADQNPNQALWWTGELETGTNVIDTKTGLPTVTEEVMGDPVEGNVYREKLGIPSIVPGDAYGTDAQRRGVGTFRFKRDGKTYAIQTYWAPMTDAIRGSERLPKSMMVIRSMAGFNRWIAVANTTLSPGFALSNLVRDYFTAKQLLKEEQFQQFSNRDLIFKNAYDKAIQDGRSKGEARRLAEEAADKGVNFANWRKAMKAYYGELKNSPVPDQATDPEGYKWRQVVKRYREAGAHTAFWKMRTPLDHYTALERISKGKKATTEDIRAGVMGIYNWMNDANTTIENAIRLVTFAAATDPNVNPNPLTDAQGASLAKNLTVNFQKRGHASIVLGGLYVFFNATMQGNVRLLGALRRSKKVRGVTAAIAAGGFVNSIMNEALGGDDEEGRSYYSQLPEYVRTRNIVLMIPNSGGRYIAIPLPYGFNVFWTAGNSMGLMANEENFARGPDQYKFLTEPVTTAMSTFSPISSSTPLRAIIPTALEPWHDISKNRNFFGSPINPDKNPFADFEGPDAYNVLNPDDRKMFQWVAQTLGNLTGGSPVKKGMVDVSPGTLEYLMDYFGGTGIAGATIHRTWDAAQALFLHGEPDKGLRKTPVIRRVYGMVPEYRNRERYYQLKEYLRTMEAQREYLLSKRREEPGLYKNFMEDNEIFWSTGTMRRLDATERSLRRIYVRRNKLRTKANKTEGQKRMLENYNKQIDTLTSRFNESYYDFIVRSDARYTGY